MMQCEIAKLQACWHTPEEMHIVDELRSGNRNTHTHTRYRSMKDSLNKSSLHPAIWKHTYGNITRFKLRCVCTRKYHRGNPVNCSWPWLQTFVTQKWQASNLVTAASLDQLSLLSSEKHVSQTLSGRYELFLYGWENDLNSWEKKTFSNSLDDKTENREPRFSWIVHINHSIATFRYTRLHMIY